ncbi:Ribosome biogenesis protein [Wickerhamomyces ciferrii]|uniref:Ribosome biogenesis protein SLX9 n=1 Tax=Wickerhamomyces ciferrii (strain ATCC 14091 / BCRC 22168 / CBS 111 / JCM 3599 / NBRC 0793 / NRRL Y-1031 F-60-10) TaxID=1206466 RepID=K0KW50_WICCF|nr:Ribosome biogenesis protein [Wickerhamomyces ciferrii]CCH45358.1 Ribosome biogenesis protein [Wickerhamomyces ciferrii]
MKRTNLRSKVAARANTTSKSTPNQQVELPEDPKAFLHEYKESKRDKLQSRHQEFLTKLNSKNDNNGNISKSSLRRRKRKQKQELAPKMNDLLTSLEDTITPETATTTTTIQPQKIPNINIIDKKFIETKTKPNKNQPNPQNKKGSKKIEQVERLQFTNILKTTSFKKSPFEALKANISNRLGNDIL